MPYPHRRAYRPGADGPSNSLPVPENPASLTVIGMEHYAIGGNEQEGEQDRRHRSPFRCRPSLQFHEARDKGYIRKGEENSQSTGTQKMGDKLKKFAER